MNRGFRSKEIFPSKSLRNGEDPMRPVMRGVLERARRTPWLLHTFLSGEEAVEVTQPSAEALQLARTYFEKGL